MPVLSWVRALFGHKTTKTIVNARKPRRRTRLDVESLENRSDPSGTPTATLQLVPGTNLGPNAPTVILNLDSYAFGFDNPVNIAGAASGAGAGKITFNDLTVTAPLTGNSPTLFKALTAGGLFSQAYLTQTGADGNPVAVWAMKLVVLDSDKIDGDSANIPEETLQLKFGSITEINKANAQSWDQTINSAGAAAALPSGVTLTDLPRPAATDATLLLYNSADQTSPTFTIALETYQFTFEHATTPGSATALRGGGQSTKLDELNVGTDLSSDSPKLLQAVATGAHYDRAVLIQNNAAGQATTVWTMKPAYATEDDISDQNGSLPTEKLHFAFAAVTEAVQANPNGPGTASAASWDQVLRSTGTTADLPTGVNLVAIPTPTAPPITLTLTPSSGSKTPVTIALDSYSFGASRPATLGSSSSGAGAGKVKFNELVINADFSKNSLVLFQSLTGGLHFSQAVLSQNDGSGQPVASWTLAMVYVTSETITAQNGAGGPTEEVHLAYDAETEANHAAVGGWNQVTNKGASGIVLPIGETQDSALAADSVPVPAATLQLTPSGIDKTPLVIPLGAYQLGFDNPIVVGSAHTGAGAGKAKFEDLTISAAFGAASPKLFQATAAGTIFSTAVLTQNDAAGKPVAVWTFTMVLATSDTIAGAGSDLPKETVQFLFGAVNVATQQQTATWDQARNTGSSGANTAGSTLDAIPPPAAPSVTLQLTPIGTGQPLTIDLDSYQFGFTNAAPVGWAGASSTKTKFNDLTVSAGFAANSPLLFAALNLGSHYAGATLTQTDGDGNVIAVWTIGTVYVTQDKIDGEPGALPEETLHFAFGAVTERTSGAATAWSQVSNTSQAPAPLPTGVTIAPIPPAANASITLELIPTGKNPTPITITINDYDFLFQHPLTLAPGNSSGAGSFKGGKTTLDELTVDTLLSANSPKLLAALTQGTHFASAVLVQNNAQGKPVAAWTLHTVFITSDSVAGNNDGLPVETLKFAFNGINEATSVANKSWDQVHNLANNLASQFDLTKFVPLDGGAPPIAG